MTRTMAERWKNRNSRVRTALVAAAVMLATPATAQMLPIGGSGLPSLPAGPVFQRLPGGLRDATNRLDVTARTAVRDTVGRPQNTRALDRDTSGARVVRGEVLAIAPNEQSLSAARSLGFDTVREDTMSSLGLAVTVLRAPDGMTASSALAALRKADPAGNYDYNHIYDPSGGESGGPAPDTVQSAAAGVARIGMIDAGVDRNHPALEDARVETKVFANVRSSPPTAHGTAIASLLVGEDGDFHGALRGTVLYAADVYGGEAAGGSAEDIVRALAWLADENVPVVNISLAGPPNALLGAATAAYIRRGNIVVAAVGNDGPAGPARFPAAYPGVAGVTSVDAGRQVQVDANRGPDVAFAARGVDVRAAALKGTYRTVTGTSFAAPLVAARFAELMPKADPSTAASAWSVLEKSAVDLGPPGRDPVFGYGYLDPPGAAPLAPRASVAP